jgi:SnoaL-like domain
MPVTLPQPIAAYFEADSTKNAGIEACFTEAAIVKDEGHTYVGRDAIGKWKAESSTKYTYVSEPIAIVKDGDQTIVTSHLTGNFPGSPVDLRYAFVLEADKIARLEITL